MKQSTGYFQVIVFPLSPKPSKMMNLLIIVSIWVLSCAIALPPLIFSQEVTIKRLLELKIYQILFPI